MCGIIIHNIVYYRSYSVQLRNHSYSVQLWNRTYSIQLRNRGSWDFVVIYGCIKRTKTQLSLHFRYYYSVVKSKCVFHYLTCLKIHGKYVCNGYLDLCLSQQHSTCRIFDFFDREYSPKKQHSISIKLNTYVIFLCLQYSLRGRRGRDRMVVGFTTTYAITQCLSPLML